MNNFCPSPIGLHQLWGWRGQLPWFHTQSRLYQTTHLFLCLFWIHASSSGENLHIVPLNYKNVFSVNIHINWTCKKNEIGKWKKKLKSNKSPNMSCLLETRFEVSPLQTVLFWICSVQYDAMSIYIFWKKNRKISILNTMHDFLTFEHQRLKRVIFTILGWFPLVAWTDVTSTISRCNLWEVARVSSSPSRSRSDSRSLLPVTLPPECNRCPAEHHTEYYKYRKRVVYIKTLP